MITDELPTAEDVARALAEVYARPEFATRTPSALALWFHEQWGRIKEFIAGLFPDVDLSAGSGRLIYWVLIAAMALAAFGILAHSLGSVEAWRRGRDRGRRSREGWDGAQDASLDADGWEERARGAAAAGDWRHAALALYQALVHRLDERGVVRYDAAKTPGDYLREARDRGTAHREFEAFLVLFVPIAFGRRPADASRYESLKAAALALGARG